MGTKLKEERLKELAVVNLDMDIFRSSIIPCTACQELWLLEFYVHWCPHCMSMMPTFYKLGVALRAAGAKLRVGAVNCAMQKELCGAFQVMGHPMVGFYYGAVGPGGSVQLFDYNGQDVRINSVLDSFKQNRDPSWDAGAPAGITLPKHLFPAEATINLVQRLPEEYRPSDAVLRWLANGSKVKATACPLPRTWYSRLQHQASDNTSVIDGEADNFRPKRFIGNGWPVQEHVAEP